MEGPILTMETTNNDTDTAVRPAEEQEEQALCISVLSNNKPVQEVLFRVLDPQDDELSRETLDPPGSLARVSTPPLLTDNNAENGDNAVVNFVPPDDTYIPVHHNDNNDDEYYHDDDERIMSQQQQQHQQDATLLLEDRVTTLEQTVAHLTHLLLLASSPEENGSTDMELQTGDQTPTRDNRNTLTLDLATALAWSPLPSPRKSSKHDTHRRATHIVGDNDASNTHGNNDTAAGQQYIPGLEQSSSSFFEPDDNNNNMDGEDNENEKPPSLEYRSYTPDYENGLRQRQQRARQSSISESSYNTCTTNTNNNTMTEERTTPDNQTISTGEESQESSRTTTMPPTTTIDPNMAATTTEVGSNSTTGTSGGGRPPLNHPLSTPILSTEHYLQLKQQQQQQQTSKSLMTMTPSSVHHRSKQTDVISLERTEEWKDDESSFVTATTAPTKAMISSHAIPPPPPPSSASLVGSKGSRRKDSVASSGSQQQDPQQHQQQHHEPPQSMLSYLKHDLLNLDSRHQDGSATEDADVQMEEFIRVPSKLETLNVFGLAAVTDAFLYVLTVLPLKFVWSCICFVITIFGPRKGNLFGLRFHRRHLYQIIQTLIVITVSEKVLGPISIGKLYHWIRGQAMIKLYVLIAIVEVFDRLMCALGQDALDSLYWNTTRRPRHMRMVVSSMVVLAYATIHSLFLFVHIATLNVAMNSADHALLTLLISGNFAEIKSTVFKKYNKQNLFKIVTSDICERFKLALFLSLILILNICQGGMNRQSVDAYMTMCGIVMASEMLADWIKHSFITKFNFIKSKVYTDFSLIIAGDVTGIGHEGLDLDHTHAVVKRVGLAQLPLVCVMARYLREAARYAILNVDPESQSRWNLAVLYVNQNYGTLAAVFLAAFVVLLGVKIALGFVVTYMARRMVDSPGSITTPPGSPQQKVGDGKKLVSSSMTKHASTTQRRQVV
eukprot:scaffold26569_cov60-Attheya_sp.AAC.1